MEKREGGSIQTSPTLLRTFQSSRNVLGRSRRWRNIMLFCGCLFAIFRRAAGGLDRNYKLEIQLENKKQNSTRTKRAPVGCEPVSPSRKEEPHVFTHCANLRNVQLPHQAYGKLDMALLIIMGKPCPGRPHLFFFARILDVF